MTALTLKDFGLDLRQWRAAESGLERQVVIALAWSVAMNGPPFNKPESLAAMDLLHAIATGSEFMWLAETESALFVESIRYMARCDAYSLGLDNPPMFKDAVATWTDLEDERHDVIRAIRRLPFEDAQRVYREEWARLRARIL